MKITKIMLSVTGALFVASMAMAAETTTGAAAGSANGGIANEVNAVNKPATKTTAQSDTSAPAPAPKAEKKAKKKKAHKK